MTLKLPPLAREIDASHIVVRKEDNVTRLSFPASSETPVERWFGEEILSHEKSAIRMDRVKRGAAPLLFNHDWDDPIGMIDGARIEDSRLVVDAHLFDTARAQEIGKMIEGGLRNVSLGYRIHVVEENKKTQVYTARDWEPYEISIVTVPADPSVGLGRSLGEEMEVRMWTSPVGSITAHVARGTTMSEQDNAAAGASAESGQTGGGSQVTGGNNRAAELEQGRIRAIHHFAKANAIDESVRDHWINTGTSVERVGEEILAIQGERNKNTKPVTHLGLNANETRRFSLRNAISAVADKNWNKAGFEAECSREIAARMGFQTDPNKFYVPLDVQERQVRTPIEDLAYRLMKRDLTVASAGAGGYLVETANIGFIELLRNRSVAFQMGAQRMPGMVGNVTIPKQSVAGTAYWLASESTGITESQQTFVQVALSPKTVGGYTEISRQLLLQSAPAAEGLVMADLAAIVALAADVAILNGSGASGQPTGIIGTSGIGAVTGTSLDYADIVEFQTDVFAGNALSGAAGYVTTGAVAGLLKGRVRFSSTASPIWDGRLEDAIVDGYRGMASNQMPSASMLFGNYQSVIVPEWGVLEIEVNPYANFAAGIVGVRAMYSMDVGVRYPTAFSYASSIT